MGITRLLDKLKKLTLPEGKVLSKDDPLLRKILLFCIDVEKTLDEINSVVQREILIRNKGKRLEEREREIGMLVLETLLPNDPETLKFIARQINCIGDLVNPIRYELEDADLPRRLTRLAALQAAAMGKNEKEYKEHSDKLAEPIANLIQAAEAAEAAEELMRRNAILNNYLNYLFNQINKYLQKKSPGDFAMIDSLAADKNALEGADEAYKDVLIKWQHIRKLQGILNDDKTPGVASKLNNFDTALQESLPAITKRRDSALMTFLKCLGVIFSAGYYYHSLFGKNATEGKKTVALLQEQPGGEKSLSLKAGR
ncbi:MAG: hypothetical protein ACD_45C00020G0004 [uncultured bacterium]|nr:MAG: hypothetical protein ACD_45C00020G0004 [uncultured bacterium]